MNPKFCLKCPHLNMRKNRRYRCNIIFATYRNLRKSGLWSTFQNEYQNKAAIIHPDFKPPETCPFFLENLLENPNLLADKK